MRQTTTSDDIGDPTAYPVGAEGVGLVVTDQSGAIFSHILLYIIVHRLHVKEQRDALFDNT